VLFDRLGPGERLALEELRRDRDFYGILRPREGAAGLGIKSVDRETALLFLTLRDPGPLPSYVRQVLGEAAAPAMTRLVADGVLEVEAGGDLVSGAAAVASFHQGGGELGNSRLARLSIEALRYGQALAFDDPLLLSFRLYSYNRRPLTPRWQQLLGSAEAVREHLGIGRGGPNRKILDRVWEGRPPSEAWLSWRARAAEPLSSREGVTWKLYVSPEPEALAGSFGEILEALAAARTPQFKIGADASGLLRPDKIVAYFPSFERLAGAAEAIASRLGGIPAQGVPFTSEIRSESRSEIGGEGLLSWGADPPADDPHRSRGGGESWRLWLTHRLAQALLGAWASGSGSMEPWRFALERLRLEGVDTETWTPGALLWREGEGR